MGEIATVCLAFFLAFIVAFLELKKKIFKALCLILSMTSLGVLIVAPVFLD